MCEGQRGGRQALAVKVNEPQALLENINVAEAQDNLLKGVHVETVDACARL